MSGRPGIARVLREMNEMQIISSFYIYDCVCMHKLFAAIQSGSDVFFCDFVAISFPCVMRNTVVVV